MKRMIFLLGLISLFSVPLAHADAGYNFDNKVEVIPYLSHGMAAVESEQVVDFGPLKSHGGPILPLEDRKAIEESTSGSVYHRADDFAPPRDLTVPAALATSVDWSETAMWLAVGLAGALGLLGAALLANRSRVRMAQS